MNKNKYIYGAIIIALALAGYFFFSHSNDVASDSVKIKCPDDYATSEEHIAALELWSNDFYDKHPGATVVDWSNARHSFWVENNCTVALQRYQDALDGKADPELMKQAEEALQEAVDSSK